MTSMGNAYLYFTDWECIRILHSAIVSYTDLRVIVLLVFYKARNEKTLIYELIAPV
jgi:hypothetical protein